MIATRQIFARLILAGAAVAGTSGAALAAPIVSGSTLNFAGQSTCNATSCTFGSAIVTSGTGSFGLFTFGSPVTFAPLTFSPFTAQQVYTATNTLGQTASFSVTSQLAESTATTGGLTTWAITDAGIAKLTGFDDTAGFFTFTANQNGSLQGSFSATADAVGSVPEPAVWGMMVMGIGAIGGMLRSRKRIRVNFRLVRA